MPFRLLAQVPPGHTSVLSGTRHLGEPGGAGWARAGDGALVLRADEVSGETTSPARTVRRDQRRPTALTAPHRAPAASRQRGGGWAGLRFTVACWREGLGFDSRTRGPQGPRGPQAGPLTPNGSVEDSAATEAWGAGMARGSLVQEQLSLQRRFCSCHRHSPGSSPCTGRREGGAVWAPTRPPARPAHCTGGPSSALVCSGNTMKPYHVPRLLPAAVVDGSGPGRTSHPWRRGGTSWHGQK